MKMLLGKCTKFAIQIRNEIRKLKKKKKMERKGKIEIKNTSRSVCKYMINGHATTNKIDVFGQSLKCQSFTIFLPM